MDTVGPYRLEVVLGRGTAGTVWRARRPGPVPQVVAVKRARIAPGTLGANRLRDEAAVLADLDHPHIVRVFDVLDDGDDVAIVMPLARGGSLRDLLAERGRLAPGQVVAVLAPVAAALGSAHRRGVLHGDVKPANILFTSDGEPLLSDFGVARSLATASPGSTGEVAGTAAYLDPELLATGRHEPRNDIYGVGVVAYFALSGRLPFTGAAPDDIVVAADLGSHPSLLEDRSVPAPLAEVVESAMARFPDERPATGEELAQALRAAVEPASVVLPGTALSAVVEDDAAPAAADDGHEGDAGDGDEGDERRHGTRLFGPRPPRPGREEPEPDRRVAVVSVLVVVALALAGILVVRNRDQATEPASAEVDTGQGTVRPCPVLPQIAVPAGGRELEADFNGDGCPLPVVWDGEVMQVRLSALDEAPRRFDFKRLIEPGVGGGDLDEAAQLLIGDWDCDGADSPALYLPNGGRVYYFASIPVGVSDQLATEREEPAVDDGLARVVEGGDDDCDEVSVRQST